MRTSTEIKELILNNAISDQRVRAVLLNGSRANSNIKLDKFQDYDIVFVVTDMNSFISDHSWVAVFGNKLIWQCPEEMSFGKSDRMISFPYLMLFEDGNRIDLTLIPIDDLVDGFSIDSLTLVWMDKDSLFSNIQESSDVDYWIKRPSEKEFLDTCNEFWWVTTYVVKGLLRNEIIYAKEMMENPVRKMFLRMIEWDVGVRTDFSVSIGKNGKFLKQYLPPKEHNKILRTYPNYKTENIISSLFLMIDIFSKYAHLIADNLNYSYNSNEQNNTITYLLDLLRESQKKK